MRHLKIFKFIFFLYPYLSYDFRSHAFTGTQLLFISALYILIYLLYTTPVFLSLLFPIVPKVLP